MKKSTLIITVLVIVFLIPAYFIFIYTVEKVTNQIIGGETNVLADYECKLKPKQREFTEGPYYSGPLIDTHVHMPVAFKIIGTVAMKFGFEDMPAAVDISTGYINCLFDTEGITKTFGFFIVPNIIPIPGRMVSHVKNIEEKYPGKFVKFFMPPLPLQIINPKFSTVKKIFNNNPGLFQGYGEARFDFNVGTNAHPEDEYFLEMYTLADENNLIVQIHPDRGQLEALSRLLEKYPHVKFLAHVMPYYKKEIGTLMDAHDNLYYSLDAEIHYIFGYHTIQNNRGPTKEEYLKFIRGNFNSLLKEGLRDWKQIIEAHPDRFTWGSDRWYTWHFDSEVSGLVVEFGRAFIGHLDPAVQERFAYKNAERMLQDQ
ncbi:MAG: Uncharacterized protein G01um101429_1083 [Parcubacteria group bacterium Gr01-1014_29]|nr:MAG: Uncharacterized protein G01um101429_1083 [Parcubacteria group bacterium Gr01-1014_29]